MRILCSNVHLEHRNNAPERQMWRRLKLGDNCRDHLLDRRTFREQAVGALDRSLEPLAWVRAGVGQILPSDFSHIRSSLKYSSEKHHLTLPQIDRHSIIASHNGPVSENGRYLSIF